MVTPAKWDIFTHCRAKAARVPLIHIYLNLVESAIGLYLDVEVNWSGI